MGGKRRSLSGLPRLLSRLNGAEGYAYRRFGAALARDLGIGPDDVALMAEVGRVARLWLEYTEASRDLDEARRQRKGRHGKPPSRAVVDRLSHRAHVASGAYAEALAALKADPGVQRRRQECARNEHVERARERGRQAEALRASQAAEAAAQRAIEAQDGLGNTASTGGETA